MRKLIELFRENPPTFDDFLAFIAAGVLAVALLEWSLIFAAITGRI